MAFLASGYVRIQAVYTEISRFHILDLWRKFRGWSADAAKPADVVAISQGTKLMPYPRDRLDILKLLDIFSYVFRDDDTGIRSLQILLLVHYLRILSQ